MATLRIPTRTDAPDYSIEIELEKQTFTLSFLWNDRMGAWFMDIADVNGERLLNGRRIVVDLPLIARFRDPRLPAGEFFAVDTSGLGLDPEMSDLGARVLLLYYEYADLPAQFKA